MFSPTDCTGRVVVTPVVDVEGINFAPSKLPYVATDATEAARSVNFAATKLDSNFVEFRLEASFPDNPDVTTP